MLLKYVISEVPPSNNKYMGRTNRWTYQDDKREWEWLVKSAVGRNKPKKPLDKAIVMTDYYFPTRHRRDPDNYSGKFILDGLVKAKVLEDDSFDNIKLFIAGYHDKENPRVEIYIRERTKELDRLLESLKGQLKEG